MFRRWIETESMNTPPQGHREALLDGLRRFVASARQIAGVRRIAILGSITTTKADPKDIDVLVVVADDADLAGLAKCSRRLQGHRRASIEARMYFLPTRRVRTSAARVIGRIAARVFARRAMPCIALSSRRSGGDSLERERRSDAAGHHLAGRRAANRIATGR